MLVFRRKILRNLIKNVVHTRVSITTSKQESLPILTSSVQIRGYASKKQNLLKYPVPPLEETLKKFLKSVDVLLTDEEFKETCKETQNFFKNDGCKLQQLLEAEAEKSTNWLATRWLQVAYLGYRDPVVVYSSPGMAFPTALFQNDDEYLQYTARAIYAALTYREMVYNNKIPVEKMGKNELDMSQYKKVFGTCRIPGKKIDDIKYYTDSKHLAVAFKNKWYAVPVYADNALISPCCIYHQLKCIYNPKMEKVKDGIGVLSALCRDKWGTAYEELVKNIKNAKEVEKIQRCLFTVSLDDPVAMQRGCNDQVVTIEQLIHGGGAKENGGNRWFDKTIQFIVNRNGANGFCYEHAPAEGQPVAVMTDFIIKKLRDKDFGMDIPSTDFEPPKELKFELNEKLCDYIKLAREHLDCLASDLHITVLHYKNYGRDFIKNQKMSPDSYIQMAIQYAFYILHKEPGAHYESAHLRIYDGGRTETIRSCSIESVAFAKAMLSKCSDEEKVEKLRNAVDGHRKYTQMALTGKGVDRHLLGLKLMAIENKLPIPRFYETPGYVKSTYFKISTSQVASKFEAFMGYGPLTPDGYGCCYNPRSSDMYFAVSSWKRNRTSDTMKFKNSLTKALDDMLELLCRAGEKPKAKV